ncbi:hypothetical protein [Streptomyces sp. NPDC049879]|uniref:hypothetical protein n=1 Tax=Streptomyces sp. NPDC049879 TaxID=3365598 RepID=UPI0037ADC991
MRIGTRRNTGGTDLPPVELPPIAVVSCHGGCGATTVARLLGPAGREVQRDALAVRDEVLVMVARGTARGMQWATEGVRVAYEHIRRGWLAEPPVLVVVADSPLREPSVVRARLRLLQDRVRGIVHMPYVSQWREVDDPLSLPVPAGVCASMAHLSSLLSPSPSPVLELEEERAP